MKKPTRYQQVLIIPDTHAPYHDKKAWALVQLVAGYYHPECCIILGDFIDCYTVSSFGKSPNRQYRLVDEVSVGKTLLRNLEQSIGPHRIFCEGNHEYRYERYITDKAPELYEYLTKKDLLDLKAHGWKVTPYKHTTKLGKIHITHDLGRAGKFSTSQSMHSYGDNLIIGHNHRMDYHVRANGKGTTHLGASFGWLGDKKYADYTYSAINSMEWALGFGWGVFDTRTGFIYLTPVPIVEYTCMVNGKVFGLKGVLNG